MKWRVPGQEADQRRLQERLQNDCQARKLNREDAMDGSRWMKQIRDDSYEWMKVSSGIGSPENWCVKLK